MKIRNICIMLVLLLVLSQTAAASAAGGVDLTKTGSITVNMRCKGEPVTTGKLTVYQVCNVVQSGDVFIFEFTEEFADCGIVIDDVESTALSESLVQYARDNGIRGTEKKVNEQGKVVFSELPLGLYLVEQTGVSSGYTTIKPFMVTLPDGEAVYDVDASPKISVEQEPQKPSGPDIPSTGQLNWPVPVLAVLGLLIFSLGWFLCFVKRKTDK